MSNTIFSPKTLKLGFLIAVEILKRNRVFIGLFFLAILLIIFAQIKFKLFYNQNSISLGFIGTYQEHDLPLEVTKLLSSGLVEGDSNGRIKAKLISGWDTNNDATIFKFKLNDGLFWADGTEIKSTDLDFAIPNVELSFPDVKSVQFNLKESYSPLPSLLAKPIFKKSTLTGTGPYKITKIEKSRIFITKIELKSDKEDLPAISIRFYPNENVAIAGFNLGEVQALFGISNPKAFWGNSKVLIRSEVGYSKIVTILFNTTDLLFSNRSLRQAFSFAAPQIEGEMVANNPYPPNFWAYDQTAKKYLANPAESASALERAKGSIEGEILNQEIILTTTPNLSEVAEKVVDSWKSLGLDIKLRVESGIAQNFQALLITQSIPLDPDQYFLWHATQTKTNLTRYDSKRVDKDLEDGRKIITEDERKEKYLDFQKTLLEDAPAVFLYFPKYNIAYLKKKEKILDKILSLQ